MADSLNRAKQSTAANFKAHCSTEKGQSEIRAFLDGVLSLQHPFDEDRREWCFWLVAGGKNPKEFVSSLKSYETPTMCGLVWNKNFVAYRCRDCGISPCMSICADCFHAGNHEGHDFNMFRSQAGGACDCGDENVMKRDGFCQKHGQTNVPKQTPPADLLAMASIVIPHLYRRLRLQLIAVDSDGSDLKDAEVLVDFLYHLCETTAIRSVAASCLMKQISEAEKHYRNRKQSTPVKCCPSQSTPHVCSQEDRQQSESSLSLASTVSKDEEKTYLDFLMDFVTQNEFPEKIVTFMLHLLPSVSYKEHFTLVFCQHYQKIAKAIVTTSGTREVVEQLSNRVVHISVQLFSNKQLAEKMVREQNLLHVMVKVLHDMIRPTLVPYKMEGNMMSAMVVSCEKQVLSNHCYWPIVSDLINILSHKTIAEVFLKNADLTEQWLNFVKCLTGMNLNTRQPLTHIEYEPNSYYAAFSVELEASSSPMWSLVNACVALKKPEYVLNMISGITNALGNWYKYVDEKPRHGELTFHLPLHRHLAAFISLAVSEFNLPLKQVLPSPELLVKIFDHLLHLQAGICEIRAGRWVRNGTQIRSQVRLYSDGHFCISMLDLDTFLLQVCVMFLDPDYIIDALIERFNVQNWLQFGSPATLGPPSFDSDTELTMVEGMLSMLVILLSTRVRLGLSESDILKQEMVSQLCIGDKTHSQLVDLIPDKPGQSHNIREFEKTLTELADYRAPTFESGSMQQGMYVPKGLVWDNHFDPVHLITRAVQRQDFQAAMGRYTTHVQKTGQGTGSSFWPPFLPLRPLPRIFEGLLRPIHCKRLHGILFAIFQKAVQDSSSVSDAVLYLSAYLVRLSLETKLVDSEEVLTPPGPCREEAEDVGCVIVSRCVDFLDAYGKNHSGLLQAEHRLHVNQELLAKLQRDPWARLEPGTYSAHAVSGVLAEVLRRSVRPPLFNSMLPFMSDVLTSALSNQTSSQEKIAQLQHIQYLLELLPLHRQDVIRKFVGHLARVSEKYKVPPKNLALVSDETQPVEMSMLLMYLIKYYDWMFKVYKVPAGWPRSASDLSLPSIRMADNVRHVVGPVLAPDVAMDTPPVVPVAQADLSGVEDRIAHFVNVTGASESSPLAVGDVRETGEEPVPVPRTSPTANGQPARTLDHTEQDDEKLRGVARNLLIACGGNLEVAIDMHFNMEESLPDLDETMGSVVMETTSIPSCPGCGNLATAQISGVQVGQASSAVTGINESILSLVVKLRATMQSGVPNPPTSRSSACDGFQSLTRLLELIHGSCAANAAALETLLPSWGKRAHPTLDEGQDDPAAENALRRKRARERQQKLLAEFASKQKVFMEQALKRDPNALEDMEVDAPDHVENYHCVICGQSSPSTEDRPVGLVVLLQPSEVLQHRTLGCRPKQLPCTDEEANAPNCGTAHNKRLDALNKIFSQVSSLSASSAGVQGGVHVQTCGHYLHVDCQQSYLKSLQAEEASQLHHVQSFSARHGEFTCPLCRQLGNSVLPIVPAAILPCHKQHTPKETGKAHDECVRELQATLQKYTKRSCLSKLSASALNFNSLGEAAKSLVDTAATLDGEAQRADPRKKFALLSQTARTNLEMEQVESKVRLLSSPRRSCFSALLRAFQFHSQSLVGPLVPVWADLTMGDAELSDTDASDVGSVPLLLRDGPSLLIQLLLTWPVAASLQDFRCFVQLTFNLVFCQSLVNTCGQFLGDERLSWQELGRKAALEKSQSSLSAEQLLGFVTHLLSGSKLFDEEDQLVGISQSVWSPQTVQRCLQECCLPFLRLASFMSTLMYDTPVPVIPDNDQEFLQLAASLNLCPAPSGTLSAAETFSCVTCLKWPGTRPLAVLQHWCGSLSAVTKRCAPVPKDMLPTLVTWPPPKLVQLPERYDSLIQHYRKRKCSKCGGTPDEPSVCLVCGKFMCLQGRCCVNECTQHARDCGAGTGVFLIVLSSIVIILRAERVCVWGSVYLDSFGEEDRDLRRGKPLFLSRDRFQRLEEQWLTHSFDHTCKRWKRHVNVL